jgi:hypothetical protein
MTSPRDAYLAWQSEIGTEEVVLTAPYVRHASLNQASPASSSSGSHTTAGTHALRGESGRVASSQSAPGLPEVHFEPMKPFVVPGMPNAGAGPEFFGAIAEQLAKSDAFTGLKASQRKKAAEANGNNGATPQTGSTVSPLVAALTGVSSKASMPHGLRARAVRWCAPSAMLRRASPWLK